MERARSTQTTSGVVGASPRRRALHLLAEIRVTGRGKQVQFYWAAGVSGDHAGHAGQVWRTVHAAALEHPESASPAGR